MFLFVLKRLLGAIPTLFFIITIAFFLIRLAPGGPFDEERTLPAEIQANLNKAYHLDKPLYVQYVLYLKNIMSGDFGPSFQYKDRTVTELIAAGFPVSLKLGISAIIIGTLFGVLLGSLAGIRQNTGIDYGVMGIAVTGMIVPGFVMAPLLVLIFAVILGYLPAGGWGESYKQMILPVIVLALPLIGVIARMMRSSMIEMLHADFVRTAKAKGLSPFEVVKNHCLKGAFFPIVSLLGPATAGIITGSLIVEQIFGLPGIGRYFVQGAFNRDYTLVMGTIIFYGILIVLFNLLVDIVYSLLDPKVKL